MAKRQNPVDVHVGERLRLRRVLVGLTQTDLGKAVGLTFQQIQKYEKGANRIGAGRLYDFSRLLDVPVSFFYDAMPDDTGRIKGPISEDTGFLQETLVKNKVLKLVRAYDGIEKDAIRKSVYELIKAVADDDKARAGGNPPQA